MYVTMDYNLGVNVTDKYQHALAIMADELYRNLKKNNIIHRLLLLNTSMIYNYEIPKDNDLYQAGFYGISIEISNSEDNFTLPDKTDIDFLSGVDILYYKIYEIKGNYDSFDFRFMNKDIFNCFFNIIECSVDKLYIDNIFYTVDEKVANSVKEVITTLSYDIFSNFNFTNLESIYLMVSVEDFDYMAYLEQYIDKYILDNHNLFRSNTNFILMVRDYKEQNNYLRKCWNSLYGSMLLKYSVTNLACFGKKFASFAYVYKKE